MILQHCVLLSQILKIIGGTRLGLPLLLVSDMFHFSVKERFHSLCVQLVEILCVWDCCGCYIKLAEFLSFIVFDPFVDLFITLCIVINTAFMALDHHDMDPTMTSTLKNGNYVSND